MKRFRRPEDGEGGRADAGNLPLVIAGGALVLALVFLLGVLTGRLLWAPPKGPEPVPRGEQERPVADPPPRQVDGAGQEKRSLTFYEELKKPLEPRGGETKTGAPVGSRAPERARSVQPPPPATRKPPERSVRAEPEAVEPAPPPVFTVQVGSFRDRRAAEALASRIRRQGVSVDVVEASVAGRTWYRVQVGRFDTRAAAEAHYKKRLRPKGIRGFVTTR